MKDFQSQAIRHADNHDYLDDDSMPRAERHAWVAALHYAKLRGVADTATRVDFGVFCAGRTDLDAAWEEWS